MRQEPAALAAILPPSLHLVGGPCVMVDGRRVTVPEGSKKLVAFVALNGRRVTRRHAAATLWPTADPHRAAGNLRSAMWRLRTAGIEILVADKCWLSLCHDVVVDVEAIRSWAKRLVDTTYAEEDLDLRPAVLETLCLLPGWYDDWVVAAREQLCQSLLRGIDALARSLVRAGRCGEAVEAALTSVSVDPLRESAQRALIEAHLAEGNEVEARRSFSTYEQFLDRELGVDPSTELTQLLHLDPARGLRHPDGTRPSHWCPPPSCRPLTMAPAT